MLTTNGFRRLVNEHVPAEGKTCQCHHVREACKRGMIRYMQLQDGQYVLPDDSDQARLVAVWLQTIKKGRPRVMATA